MTTDSTKALIGTIAGLAALVAIFAIMADCSKGVSRTSAASVEACVQRGGKWIGDNAGAQPNTDFCEMPDQRK
jgi:hypothetical protein